AWRDPNQSGRLACRWLPHVIRLTTITLRHFNAGERAPSTTPEADSYTATKISPHSMSSSVRKSTEGGTSSPSTFAVLRSSTVSNLVGGSTGRSEGLAPLIILPA